jgi:predicted glycoside hydrolase/deacetylase ChbG (UPF0249 family)
MGPNPLLRRLGFSDSDRVAIVHADDVGMCQASIEAFKQLNEVGILTCGAVMVPCPWFPSAAQYAVENPQADIGVHLTLTCEWQYYRWGPVSTRDPRSGLMDEQGFFPRKSRQVQESADPAAARIEMAAQVERARAFGIDVTHIDTHMGSVAHPKFAETYIGLAMSNQIPAMMLRADEEDLVSHGMDRESAAKFTLMMQQLEHEGVPLVDKEIGLPLEKPEGRMEQARAILEALPQGVTHFLAHPCVDTPELRAITSDWAGRVADYQFMMREETRALFRELGIHTIGYRAIRDVIRSGN